MKKDLTTIEPTETETQIYIVDYCKRYDISLEKFCDAGHLINIHALNDFMGENQQDFAKP